MSTTIVTHADVAADNSGFVVKEEHAEVARKWRLALRDGSVITLTRPNGKKVTYPALGIDHIEAR